MEVHAIRAGMDALHRFLNQRMDQLAEDIATDARTYAHVDTGELSTHIDAETGQNPRIIRSEADDVSFYAEVGTSKMDAIPYLRPALYQERSL